MLVFAHYFVLPVMLCGFAGSYDRQLKAREPLGQSTGGFARINIRKSDARFWQTPVAPAPDNSG